ncbi:helix-turn-helix domain-containing protein [Sulfurospirillum halorespirans]|uniref:HTH cro/C1-type domain-containing protein n=1 Tax=Sulfurospirillum halorespirans DSM 13726 TaxID=1193502 RepID=A0A1D7TGU3_9BACT|nr:helix-turn-helix transcriptional regulator [Sulfurospirillum halorespirans]AOO64209.1 hypothetical protein SHALO_0413 [Sulfurospirillum halorespirans DSM 13726]
MIEQFMDQIVENVKAERTKRGISQLALAQILGHKSPNYVAKIETRKHDVSYNLEHLYRIAYEFGLEVRDLIPSIENSK